MSKNMRFFLLKNSITYLWCIFIGIICSTFLNFNVEKDNVILFLILVLSGMMISIFIDYVFKDKKLDSEMRDNKSIVMYVVIYLTLRWFPRLFPRSIIELVFFLTVIFLLIIGQKFFIDKKINWIFSNDDIFE
jgi:membrane-associated HD superfamily phosphohydrolase